MRWWPLPALILALAAGYLLGARGVAPEAARAPRANDAPAAADPPPAPPPFGAPHGDAPPSIAQHGIKLVTPDPASASEDAEPGQGTLVVDFTGFDGPAYARVEAPGIDGSLTYMEQGAADEGLVSLALCPGDVLVRWEDRGAIHRFAARARVEEGRVTRLVAAGHAPLPDPPGLAVLDVRVAGAAGGSLPDVEVGLAGDVLDGRQQVWVCTDREGRARFRVRAGSYAVMAGDREDAVSLGAGERRVLELRHEAHGEVVVDPALEGQYSLLPSAEGAGGGRLVQANGRGGVRFPFVEPGSYQLWYGFTAAGTFACPPDSAFPDRRVVGSLEVRAGRVERIADASEPGFLDVGVGPGTTAAGRWQMRVSSLDASPGALLLGLQAEGGALRGRTGPMPRGPYRVEILADGRVLKERWAVVGHGRTRLEIELSR